MDKAKALYDAGKLDEAIQQLKNDVKSNPSDVGRRSFLFDLLCFAGDYAGAGKQLDVIAMQSAQAEAGAQVYKNVLVAEQSRRRVFHNGMVPDYLTSPPQYIKNHLEAIKAWNGGREDELGKMLEKSEAEWQLKGTIDGKPFSQFSECHDLLGPILELIIHDKYIWLPFAQIKQLQIEQPKELRDLLWISTRFELHDGQVFGGYIPIRYIDSETHSDSQVKLARMTDWQTVNDEIYLAVGQRMFMADDEANALLQIREIHFEE